MSGSVIVRHGVDIIEDRICPDDRPLSWEEADARAGYRLDRRKRWGFIDGQLCETADWTQACSGCTYAGEERGGGCHECGHRGVVRNSMWVPVNIQQLSPKAGS